MEEERELYSDRRDYNKLDEKYFYDLRDNIDTFFFILGFPKAATTTIYHSLRLQNGIFLPKNKEPNFFSTDEYEYGMGFYWEKYFESDYDGEKIVGEACTANSFIPYVTKRIKNKLPKSKLIFSIRNPIDRAYSNWHMYWRSGLENLSFEEAVEWEHKELEEGFLPIHSEDDRFWKWYRNRQIKGKFGHNEHNEYIRRRTVRTYLTRGYYYLHIKRFLEYFDKSDILIIRQKNLKNRKKYVVEKITDFLGSEGKAILEESRNRHVSSKNRIGSFLSRKILPYKDKIPDTIWSVGRKIVTQQLPAKIAQHKMEETVRGKLFEFYEKKNKKLENLIGKDLSMWSKKTKY